MFWNETCVLNGSEEKIAERFRPFYNVKIQEDYISGKLGAKFRKSKLPSTKPIEILRISLQKIHRHTSYHRRKEKPSEVK